MSQEQKHALSGQVIFDNNTNRKIIQLGQNQKLKTHQEIDHN